MKFELIVNEKISLRLRSAADAEELFALTDKNRDHLALFLPWVEKIHAVSDSLLFIEKCREKFENKTALDLGIFYENNIAGGVSFVTLDIKNECGEIGYWLGKEYEGRGIMTECVKKLIEYGFTELGLHRIKIRCDSRNERSRKIAEKIGFVHEATLRESKKHEDGYSDGLMFGLLKKDYSIK